MDQIQILSFGPLFYCLSITIGLIVAPVGTVAIEVSNENFFTAGRYARYAERFIGRFVNGSDGESIQSGS